MVLRSTSMRAQGFELESLVNGLPRTNYTTTCPVDAAARDAEAAEVLALAPAVGLDEVRLHGHERDHVHRHPYPEHGPRAVVLLGDRDACAAEHADRHARGSGWQRPAGQRECN